MLLLDEEKKNLCRTLRSKGIHDELLLKAFFNVPREKFITEALRKFAYDDNALPIEGNQTISQPYTVAIMTMLLGVQPNHKVLEIGTGSGYQTAILCELGAEVYSIERVLELYERAQKLLSTLKYKPHLKVGDGTMGWKEHSPFDRIIITAGGPNVPQKLLDELTIGGILVMPVGSKESQRLYTVRKTDDGFDYETKDHFRFVPLIGEEGWNNL